MPAYLLILLAIVSRVVPHPGWYNFTAVGGSLLFFGARRPLRQMAIPVVLLALTDYYLTAIAYGYPFHVSDYLVTWAWYAAVLVLGKLLLESRTSVARIASAVGLSATMFFLASNFVVWQGFGSYPHTAAGLLACYVAALPFYGRDLLSTGLVAGLAFGLPVMVRHFSPSRASHSTASF